MSSEGWIKAQCPKCGTIEVFSLTEEHEEKLVEAGGIISLAFDHRDHVFVIAVDATRDIRGEYVYDKLEKSLSVPVAQTIDTSKEEEVVEFLMKKAKKWINFIIKNKDRSRVKIIGDVTDDEIKYIVDIVKNLRGIKSDLKNEKTLVEVGNKKKTYLVHYNREGDIVAAIVRTGKREDVEKTREVIQSLLEKG